MSTLNLALLGIIIIILVLVSPMFTIWALNTLFPALAMPLNLWTWLAVCWLHIVVGGSVAYKKS